jgi:thiol-activated cytolysin
MALGKPAYQSSTHFGSVADRAVDGNLSQSTTDNSCFHTQYDTNAYWEVDLGEKVFIDHVTIYTRENLDDSFCKLVCCISAITNNRLI